MRVERSLLICFVPRSGSWFLSGLLASTGVLGAPRQFFWEPGERETRLTHGFGTDEEYLDWVLATGTSSNGMFGCKFDCGERSDVVQRLRQAVADEDVPDSELLARAFPSPRYVWLRREDTVAQAVSWARALQTDQWRSSSPANGEARFDAGQIAGLIELIGSETADWAAWFAEQGIEPLVVSYEELLTDPQAPLERIATFAGVSLPEQFEPRPYPGYDRQADHVNEEWARRYRG